MDDVKGTRRSSSQVHANAPKVDVVEWRSLVVARYSDGSAKAWHNRLDLGTRRLVTVRLCDPVEPSTDLPWYVLALTNAADEVELDHRMQQGLW